MLNKKLIPLILLFLGLYCICGIIYMLIDERLNRLEFCEVISEKYSYETCTSQSIQRSILDNRLFRSGISTKQEVNQLIGEYLVGSHQTEYGYLEFYDIGATPHRLIQESFSFTYDKDGILLHISATDD